MSYLTDLHARSPREYTCVLEVMKYWVPFHVVGSKMQMLSEYPMGDANMAKVAGKTFAELKGLSFHDTSNLIEMPLITILKNGSDWYPGELYPDKICLLRKFENKSLNGSKEDATEYAQVIALMHNKNCVPELGDLFGDIIQFPSV